MEIFGFYEIEETELYSWYRNTKGFKFASYLKGYTACQAVVVGYFVELIERRKTENFQVVVSLVESCGGAFKNINKVIMNLKNARNKEEVLTGVDLAQLKSEIIGISGYLISGDDFFEAIYSFSKRSNTEIWLYCCGCYERNISSYGFCPFISVNVEVYSTDQEQIPIIYYKDLSKAQASYQVPIISTKKLAIKDLGLFCVNYIDPKILEESISAASAGKLAVQEYYKAFYSVFISKSEPEQGLVLTELESQNPAEIDSKILEQSAPDVIFDPSPQCVVDNKEIINFSLSAIPPEPVIPKLEQYSANKDSLRLKESNGLRPKTAVFLTNPESDSPGINGVSKNLIQSSPILTGFVPNSTQYSVNSNSNSHLVANRASLPNPVEKRGSIENKKIVPDNQEELLKVPPPSLLKNLNVRPSISQSVELHSASYNADSQKMRGEIKPPLLVKAPPSLLPNPPSLLPKSPLLAKAPPLLVNPPLPIENQLKSAEINSFQSDQKSSVHPPLLLRPSLPVDNSVSSLGCILGSDLNEKKNNEYSPNISKEKINPTNITQAKPIPNQIIGEKRLGQIDFAPRTKDY